jgi:5-methylcytosine-specific restriction endonuclease McrA
MITRTPIKRKKCKCSDNCKLYPTLGYSGFNFTHAPEELKEKIGGKKELQQKKANAAKYASTKLRMSKYKEDTELDMWFRRRRMQMVGYCSECGRSTNKDSEKYFKWSICHIVPKSICPSVAKNYFNWIELCQTCHQEFDNTFERASKMKCFHEAKTKFQLFKELLPPEELRKVNPHLLK